MCDIEIEMILTAGVHQDYIYLAPTLLQQYKLVLQVCHCPNVCLLLLLVMLVILYLVTTEKVNQQTCLQVAYNRFLWDAGNGSTSKTCFLPYISSSCYKPFTETHWEEKQIPQKGCRAMMGVHLLLLKAGDIESNPGPKGRPFISNSWYRLDSYYGNLWTASGWSPLCVCMGVDTRGVGG